jgi:hypothetical protein
MPAGNHRTRQLPPGPRRKRLGDPFKLRQEGRRDVVDDHGEASTDLAHTR